MIISRDHRGKRESTDVAMPQPVVKFTYGEYRTTPPDKRDELLRRVVDGSCAESEATGGAVSPRSARGRELGNLIVEHAMGNYAPYGALVAPCSRYVDASRLEATSSTTRRQN